MTFAVRRDDRSAEGAVTAVPGRQAMCGGFGGACGLRGVGTPPLQCSVPRKYHTRHAGTVLPSLGLA
jgi:hypothetical protein